MESICSSDVQAVVEWRHATAGCGFLLHGSGVVLLLRRLWDLLGEYQTVRTSIESLAGPEWNLYRSWRNFGRHSVRFDGQSDDQIQPKSDRIFGPGCAFGRLFLDLLEHARSEPIANDGSECLFRAAKVIFSVSFLPYTLPLLILWDYFVTFYLY